MYSLFFFLILGLYPSIGRASAIRFDFRDAIQRNSLEITVQGPLERTTALSHFVSGWAEFDPENMGAGIRGELEFDTRTLETGIEGKNLFLKERILESGQFPLFQAAFIKLVPPVKGKAIDTEGAKFKAEVGIKVKGQGKQIQVPIHLRYFKESDLTRQRLPGNLAVISSESDISLEKLGISIPEGFKSAAASQAHIALHIVGSDKLPVGMASLPEGFKPKDVQASPSPAPFPKK